MTDPQAADVLHDHFAGALPGRAAGVRFLFRARRRRISSWLWNAVVLLSMSSLVSCHPQAARGIDPETEFRKQPQLWTVCGSSVEGRPIRLSEQGNGDHTVLIFGSLHGDEEVGGLLVARLAEFVSSGMQRGINGKIVFVPVVNPDGVSAGRRWNANGVDINRNFPTENWQKEDSDGRPRHGNAPASEPETRLMMALIDRYKPGLIIALHAPLHVVNYDGPAREIAEQMGERNGYPVSGSIGYPTPGSLGTYAGVERGIPIITLELPRVDVDEAWEQNCDALLFAVGLR